MVPPVSRLTPPPDTYVATYTYDEGNKLFSFAGKAVAEIDFSLFVDRRVWGVSDCCVGLIDAVSLTCKKETIF